jgi:hypothetical protein
MGLSPVWGTSIHSLEDATETILKLLYEGEVLPQSPVSNSTPRKTQRNLLIRQRYADGESAPHLAKDFGISEQRIYQILHGKRK